jgi:hypothetical protein
MRALNVLFAVLAFGGFATGACAAGKMRVAQTSTVTNCMMSCNSGYATCQSACIVPGTPPSSAATTTSNATASSSCLLGCTNQEQSCQSNCARLSPSQ